MIDYILVFVACAICVSFDVMSNIKKLRVKFPKAEKKEIFDTYFAEEWDSLYVSVIVFTALEFTLFIIRYNEVILPNWIESWGMYAIAGVINYSGQRIAYKILGTAEKALGDKFDKIDGN